MIPKNNPMARLMEVMQMGGDASPIVNEMAKMDPRISQAQQLMRGKRGNSLRSTCINAYKERGVDIEKVAGFYRIQLPK